MTDDEPERVARLREQLARLRGAREIAELNKQYEAAEDGLANDIPQPGYWHPWYRDKPWLNTWLNGGDPMENSYRLSVFPKRTFVVGGDAPVSIPRSIVVLHKQFYRGPAPYVGDPFQYEWTAARDDLGRFIAGLVEIVYTGRHR